MINIFKRNKIQVVNVQALSYSGTTWLNLLLGSHPDVFTLGPPHAVFNTLDDLSNRCLVHSHNCPVWTGFNETWNRKDNLLLALAKYTNKKIFMMDNAGHDFIKNVLSHPNISVLEARYIRDGRAITASYARKIQDKNLSYRDTLLPQAWFYHSFQAIPSLEKLKNRGVFTVHYENAVKNTSSLLERAGKHLDIKYDENASRFWEYDHHITSGNVGPISMVKAYQGVGGKKFESKEYYETQLEKMINSDQSTFEDTRCKKQLTREDLFWFDILLGERNQLLGYDRDTFSDTEREEFLRKAKSDTNFVNQLPVSVFSNN